MLLEAVAASPAMPHQLHSSDVSCLLIQLQLSVFRKAGIIVIMIEVIVLINCGLIARFAFLRSC